MPRLTASKDEIKGLPPMTAGIMTIRCDGFKPKFSKDRGSINLNPILKVTNHPEYNDRTIFENLNTKGKWVWKDFCHAFGVPLVEDKATGDFDFPGEFEGTPGSDPETWKPYVGPLLGQLAQIMLIQADDTKGGIKNAIDSYICKVPGCQEKHTQHLVK